LTLALASRHRRAQFLILITPADSSALTALASLLFDPPEPQHIGKHSTYRDFSTLSCALIFFLLALSSLTLPTLVHKPEVWLLNVLR
jgi:hypothetical protein